MSDLTIEFSKDETCTGGHGAARVGIGGPVGSGKTRLVEQLIPRFAERGTSLAVITNDLVTREDAERGRNSGLIAPERVRAVKPVRARIPQSARIRP